MRIETKNNGCPEGCMCEQFAYERVGRHWLIEQEWFIWL